MLFSYHVQLCYVAFLFILKALSHLAFLLYLVLFITPIFSVCFYSLQILFFLIWFFSFLVFQLIHNLFSQPNTQKSTTFTFFHSTLLFSWLTLHTTCIHCFMCLYSVNVCLPHLNVSKRKGDIYLRWQCSLFSDYYNSRMRHWYKTRTEFNAPETKGRGFFKCWIC